MKMNPPTTATNAIATSTITIGFRRVVLLWPVCATPFSICNIYPFKDIKSSEKKTKHIANKFNTDLPQQSVPNMNLEAKLLANDLQNILNDLASILEITSNTSAVKNIPYTNSLNPAFHGIPRYLSETKSSRRYLEQG
jgi:hypothetical protein